MMRLGSWLLPIAAILAPVISFGQTEPLVKAWGTLEGKQVSLYTLRNASGMQVTITNYGGTITQIVTKDRTGKFGDVVLGFESLADYQTKAKGSYFGATIGRYANRIAHGTFSLDGKTYHVPTNEGANSLHGGVKGFDKQVWTATTVPSQGRAVLELHYLSPDGDQGFPGNLNVAVRFTLKDDNELEVAYTATTDKDTVLNLTNHSYFNLSGPGSGTILQDRLMIPADSITPVAKDLIPTGLLARVDGSPFDFRKMTTIGSRIGDKNQQLKIANGYDHNWVLRRSAGGLGLAARVEDPNSGRTLEVRTDQPGVQFYTGNFLTGSVSGIGGAYNFRSALCLETQHFPDSPNHPDFPSTELKAGQQFHSTTTYKFSTQ